MSRTRVGRRQSNRKGAVMILIAGAMLALCMLLALVVDVGYIAVTKTQLQAGADGAALAGAMELPAGLTLGATKTPAQAQAAASQHAVAIAGSNRDGDRSSIYVNAGRDIRFGNAQFVNGAWQLQWNTQPYNMIGVSALRNQTGSSSGDGPLPLFFSGLLGATANLSVTATAAVFPGTTFYIPPNSTLTSTVMPFAMDSGTWNQLENGSGPDAYSYNSSTNTVSNGPDGIHEVNMYPNSSLALSGNQGTVDLGTSNNGTTQLSRQITSGLDAQDLSAFPNNQLTASPTSPLVVSGNPGLSASLKSPLDSIIGEPRSVPIFNAVGGTGGTVTYSIVGFVGIRVMSVTLTGNNKVVWVQPAVVVDATLQPSIGSPVTSSSIFAPVMLIQ